MGKLCWVMSPWNGGYGNNLMNYKDVLEKLKDFYNVLHDLKKKQTHNYKTNVI